MPGSAPIREPIIDPKTGKMTPVWERYFVLTLNETLQTLSNADTTIDYFSIISEDGKNQINALERLLFAIVQPQNFDLLKRIENIERLITPDPRNFDLLKRTENVESFLFASVPQERRILAKDVSVTDSDSYFTGTNVETVTQEIGQGLLVHNLNGFEDFSSATLSYAGTPPTLTITFTGTVYWWSDGVRYSGTGTDSIAIADTSGLYVIYYDGDTLSTIADPTPAQEKTVIENKAIVAYLYWNTNNDTVPYAASELHGVIMSGVTHHYLHDTVGLAYEEGGAISGYTLDTASDAAISFDLTNIVAYDEDIPVRVTDGIASNHYEQVLTGDAEIPVIYRDAIDQSWTEQAAGTLPYLTGATPRIQYMDKDNSYALTEVDNRKFCSYWLILTNDWQYPVKMVPGDQQYNSINDAENNAQAELLDLGDLPAQEIAILYQFVMQDGNGGTTDAMIEAVIDFRGATLKGNDVTATDHGALSGLGDDDHPQYFQSSITYDDIKFDIRSGKEPPANYPDYATFTTNTKAYKFDVDDYIDLESNELLYWWTENTDVYFHVHAALNGANISGVSQYAKFTLYIAYADVDDVFTETSKDIEIEIPTGTADMTHLFGEATALTFAAFTITTQLQARVKRIAATTGDEYPNHIFITQVGGHAEA